MAKLTAKIVLVLVAILFVYFLMRFLMEWRTVLHYGYHGKVHHGNVRKIPKLEGYFCDHINTLYKMSPAFSFLENYCKKCASTLKDNLQTDQRLKCPCISPYLGEIYENIGKIISY